MASKVIDLTGDSSDIDQAPLRKRKRTDDDKENVPEHGHGKETWAQPHKRMNLQPTHLQAAFNEGSGSTRPPGMKSNVTGASEALSHGLQKAIDGMSTSELKHWVREYALSNTQVARTMEGQLLVPGKEVVRYHADSESEDRGESESEEDISDEDSVDDGKAYTTKWSKPLKAGNDEMVPRKAVCEHCKEEFDVTLNDRGDCNWHPGEKEIDYHADMWADHDENCHGPLHSFYDNPNYADGFMWSCCEKEGSDSGCKSTRHKAAVNVPW